MRDALCAHRSEGVEVALLRNLRNLQARLAGPAAVELDPDGELARLLNSLNEELSQHASATSSSHDRRAILDALPANIALLAPDGAIVAVNEAWRRFARENGLPRADFAIGQNYLQVCDGATGLGAEAAREAAAGIRAVVEGRSDSFDLEYPCHSPTTMRWFSLHVTPLGLPRRGGVVVMHLDITAQRQAATRLKEKATILDQAKDAILVWDMRRQLTYWSRGAERLYGWRRDEALGRDVDTLLKTSVPDFRRAAELTWATGKWHGRFKQSCRNGEDVLVESNWTLVRDASGAPQSIIAITTDIGDRVALEAQLRQAQRLEAVGQLTGGIAHDFNNLLQVILGSADLLVEQLAAHERLATLPVLIRTAAERGAELTRRLLAFSRRQPLEPRPTDINDLLRGMTELLRSTLGEQVSLTFSPGDGLWPVIIDPTQFESAVLNLCINARDAMPAGGRLDIETANVSMDAKAAAEQTELAAGDYVAVTITDSGVGMDAEVLARAFEPFFTTKAPGGGTGLGLSMVYGFAKQSEGHVSLDSRPAEGTIVRLYLPRAPIAPTIEVAPDLAGERGPLLRGRGENILLVEDDELVLAHVANLLEGLGYRIVIARDGIEALDHFARHADIDLLLTDVIMPGGVNGHDLAARLRMTRPGLPVLFTSGYAENVLVHNGRLEPGTQLLSKPYRRQELAMKLRAVLDDVGEPD
ncbi:MAG: PAS domain-containing protein [Proteobacteria bacterium]|nr:PAS domain-containing protein [Pseudomonadota bacterium]